MLPNLSEKESASEIISFDKEESKKDAFNKEDPVDEVKKRISEEITKVDPLCKKDKLKNRKPRRFMTGAKKGGTIFDTESEEIILTKMAEFETFDEEKKIRNKFAEIAKLIPYDQRQICNRWRNYLNPKLCHDPLSEKEKQFINNWIQKIEPSTQTKLKPLKRVNNSGKISKHKRCEKPIEWKKLRQALEEECGFFRSENIIKNYWYPSRTKEQEQGENNDLEQEENNDPKLIQEDVEENENMIVSSPCGDSMISNNAYNNTTRITTMPPHHGASRSFSLPPISSILNDLPRPPQRSHTLPSISGNPRFLYDDLTQSRTLPPMGNPRFLYDDSAQSRTFPPMSSSRFLYDDSTQNRTLPPISSILNNPSQGSILLSTSFISDEPSCLYDYSTQNRPRLPPPFNSRYDSTSL